MTDEDSSVERIKKLLNQRNARSKMHARRKLHSEAHKVGEDWSKDEFTELPEEGQEQSAEMVLDALHSGRVPDQDPLAEALYRAEPTSVLSKEKSKRKLAHRFIRTLFIASAVFFILTGALAANFLLFGGRQVSCENIVLDVRGPASIPSGKELILNVSVLNQNIVSIEGAEIVFDYPEGTRSAQNTTISLPSQREQVGTIESSERVRTTGRAVLFGKERTEHEIAVSVEFTIKDSNASWSCEVPYKIALATAPVSVTVSGLNEVSSSQELELTVEVKSNSDELVRNVRLVATYPYGFDFLSASPKPTTANSVWDIGDVLPESTRTITIRGRVTGYGTESRSVVFEIGEASTNTEEELNIILQTIEHPFLLTSPFLATSLKLDDSSNGDYSTVLGTNITGVLTWTNQLQDALYDIEIDAVLPGVIVDRRSVKVTQGFFRSVDSTMLWTPQTNEALRKIEPGKSGTVAFSFKTFPPSEFTSATNPFINISFNVRARRISDNKSVEQSLTGQATRKINFITDVKFDALALYGVGPFTNTGPHPPRVDEETTYTVTWRLKNTTNTLDGAEVVGELPINATWLGMISPSSENVIFNPVSRKITWSLGALVSGTGYKLAAREVSFQVALTPSITELGDAPNIVEDMRFKGVDSFTGNLVQSDHRDITTELSNDPFFPDDRGRVRE